MAPWRRNTRALLELGLNQVDDAGPVVELASAFAKAEAEGRTLGTLAALSTEVTLSGCQARMTGELLNVAQAAAALDAPLGSLRDESAAPLWLDAPLKPNSR